jgi:hypothetical protein
VSGYPAGRAAFEMVALYSWVMTPVTGERIGPKAPAMLTEKQIEKKVMFFFHDGQF